MPNPEDRSVPICKPEFFDAAYYGAGGRGGFKRYIYTDPEIQEQLGRKFENCRRVSHDSVLFIGCATGFEVANWRLMGKASMGVDISEYAIANQIPEAGGGCRLYNGSHLNFLDESFDLVAAFDVMTLVDPDILPRLVLEMKRVCKVGIVIRTVVKNYRNLDRLVDGQDGAIYRYLPLWEWDRLFTEGKDFILTDASISWNAEAVLTFHRVGREDSRLKHLVYDV